MKKEFLSISKEEALQIDGIVENDLIFPIVCMEFRGKLTVIKNGKLFDENKVIIIHLESSKEFLEFERDYNAKGFDYSDMDNVLLKNVLPTLTVSQYRLLKDVENISSLIKEYI